MSRAKKSKISSFASITEGGSNTTETPKRGELSSKREKKKTRTRSILDSVFGKEATMEFEQIPFRDDMEKMQMLIDLANLFENHSIYEIDVDTNDDNWKAEFISKNYDIIVNCEPFKMKDISSIEDEFKEALQEEEHFIDYVLCNKCNQKSVMAVKGKQLTWDEMMKIQFKCKNCG